MKKRSVKMWMMFSKTGTAPQMPTLHQTEKKLWTWASGGSDLNLRAVRAGWSAVRVTVTWEEK